MALVTTFPLGSLTVTCKSPVAEPCAPAIVAPSPIRHTTESTLTMSLIGSPLMIHPACRRGGAAHRCVPRAGSPEIALHRRDRQGISAGFYITRQGKASQIREPSRSSQPRPVLGIHENAGSNARLEPSPYRFRGGTFFARFSVAPCKTADFTTHHCTQSPTIASPPSSNTRPSGECCVQSQIAPENPAR